MRLMIVKQLSMLPPKRESEDEIDEKIYKEPKLETAIEIEKQAIEDEKKLIKGELELSKIDVQIAKESDIKKIQDIFDEVKEEEPINVENVFFNDNDIFDSEEISNADREFLIDLLNRTDFNVDTKRFIEESNVPKMEIVHPEEKKIEKKEQMLTDDNEKRENARVGNSLMKKVKIKNQFEEEQEKNKNKSKKILTSAH